MLSEVRQNFLKIFLLFEHKRCNWASEYNLGPQKWGLGGPGPGFPPGSTTESHTSTRQAGQGKEPTCTVATASFMAEWLRRSLAESKARVQISPGKKFRKKFRKKKKKKKKRPAILCLHDGSPDDGSAPQLVKRLGCVLSCLYD